MLKNLVGQTVRFSPQNKRDGGNKTRTLYISKELISEGKRYYTVNDTNGGESFYALADKYDEFFLIRKAQIKPVNHRETIQNKSQIDYKM